MLTFIKSPLHKIALNRYFILQRILLFLVSISIFVNGTHFFLSIKAEREKRKAMPSIFLGNKFLGLPDILPNIHEVGYLTDKNLATDKLAAAQLAQAQYVLAPIVLKIEDHSLTFFILDFSNETKAWEKARSLGLIPLKRNSYGIILARKGP